MFSVFQPLGILNIMRTYFDNASYKDQCFFVSRNISVSAVIKCVYVKFVAHFLSNIIIWYHISVTDFKDKSPL